MIKLWIGAKLAIIVTNPKYIEKILTSPAAIEKDSVYDFIGLVGNGLFVRNGKEWQDLRKPLDKLLTKKMVESNLDMFHEKSIKLCNVLNKYAKTGENFNVRHYITNFTTDALSVSTFGHDLNEIEKDNHNISELIDCVIENLVKVVKNFINVIYLPLATISNEGKRLKEICKSLWKLSCENPN
uniref:Uncharacterized protein n=1 Tax=Rhodnius prolixus TaxID=13249 RepID=T1HTD4_RHOPR